MKDKKGFTLVELLAVILIIGILLAIAIPGIMIIRDRMTDRSFIAKGELIESAAVLYAEQNSNYLKSQMGTCSENGENCECDDAGACYYVFDVNIETLVKEGLLKTDSGSIYSSDTCNVTDPRDSTKCLDCATITIKLSADHKVASATFNTSTATGDVNCINPSLPGGSGGNGGSGNNNYITPSYLAVQTDNSNVLGNSSISKSSIENITTVNNSIVPNNAIASWDVSEAQNGTVLAWYTDADANGKYELYIGQDGGVIANVDSSYLFAHYENATSINLSNLITSNVENMYRMFLGCYSLTSLDVSNLNTSKATNLSAMFYDCKSLTSLDLRSFNTSKVTTFYGMFQGCYSLVTLNLSSFDTSKVEDFGMMFQYCYALTNLDITNFNTSNATSMFQMFVDCRALVTIDLTNFDTSNVTTMSNMFCGCRSLTSLDFSSFNTSKVYSMFQMFYGCSKLTSLDLTMFDTSKVTEIRGMFAYCSNLKTINVSNKFVTTSVNQSNNMFADCTKLVGGMGTTYNSSYTDKTYARIDAPGVPGYFTGSITLPNDYNQISYLQSSGGQYIDTGIKTQPNLKVYFDLELTQIGNIIFGNHYDPQFSLLTYGGNGRWVIVLDNGESNNPYQSQTWSNVFEANSFASPNTRYKIEFYGGTNYQYLTVNNEKVIEATTTFTTVSSTNNLHLFRRNESSFANDSNMKLYSCQIYLGDELVRSFIPALRKSDNKPGLYDFVSNTFFTNMLSGDDFTYGS